MSGFAGLGIQVVYLATSFVSRLRVHIASDLLNVPPTRISGAEGNNPKGIRKNRDKQA